MNQYITEKGVIYIHGKGGNAEEAAYYNRYFPDSDVVGFDYKSQTPWDAVGEFSSYFDSLRNKYHSIRIIANSLGAYFALNALGNAQIEKAYLISPVVDMEKLINDMMQWAGVTEVELKERGTIKTSFGETLSFHYLNWVRLHPISWTVPTKILYGSKDNMQSLDTIMAFAKNCGADLTVMENGEHWFHTEEQMQFLAEWIRNS